MIMKHVIVEVSVPVRGMLVGVLFTLVRNVVTPSNLPLNFTSPHSTVRSSDVAVYLQPYISYKMGTGEYT